MKKTLFCTIVLTSLMSCSQTATKDTPPENTDLSSEAAVLMRFLEAYAGVSKALALNSDCEVLPEPVSNRFEGYVSALNVRLHRSNEISKSVLEEYQNQWRETAANPPDGEPVCDDAAIDQVNETMAMVQALYRQLP